MYNKQFMQDGMLYDDVFILHGATLRELVQDYGLDAKFDIYAGQGQYYYTIKKEPKDD